MTTQQPEDSSVFHRLAKEAGNQLRTYILSFASAAAGVFFYTLTSKDVTHLSGTERILVGLALISYVITAFICLYELHIDAVRFFKAAKQIETPIKEQDWTEVNSLKGKRLRLIYSSYAILLFGVILTAWYLALRLTLTPVGELVRDQIAK